LNRMKARQDKQRGEPGDDRGRFENCGGWMWWSAATPQESLRHVPGPASSGHSAPATRSQRVAIARTALMVRSCIRGDDGSPGLLRRAKRVGCVKSSTTHPFAWPTRRDRKNGAYRPSMSREGKCVVSRSTYPTWRTLTCCASALGIPQCRPFRARTA